MTVDVYFQIMETNDFPSYKFHVIDSGRLYVDLSALNLLNIPSNMMD